MKRVLSVQDLSCLGKCSLSVALPVLSAMGVSCSVLPTAVLSTHTAFPGPHVRDLTGDIAPVCDHWKTIGAEFDAIGIGYLSDPVQAGAVEYLLECFPAFTVLDPVMGDHGKLYKGMTGAHVEAMKKLCRKARVLLPNVTEACLLTGTAYRDAPGEDFYRQLLEKLQELGPDTVILTGVTPASGMTGYMGIDKNRGVFSRFVKKIPKSCHGTGDLFAAVFTGSCVKGMSPEGAAETAAAFVEAVLETSPETPFGVEFEPHLALLCEAEGKPKDPFLKNRQL